MAKVTTVDNGIQQTEVIVDKKPTKTTGSAVEIKADNQPAPSPETTEPVKAEKPEIDEGLEPEDQDLAERAKKRIGKKHYEMKKAQEEAQKAREEAEENERFAENLFNEREQWRIKAEQAERRAAELEQKTKPPVEEKAPDENDPKYKLANGDFAWRQFSDDNAAFQAKKAIAEDRKAQAERQAKVQQEQAEAETRKRVEEAKKKYPDFQKVVLDSGQQLQNEALQYIATSEYGMDIAYFLGTHPEIAEKIKALHPIRAIAELGKIETSFEKPASPAASAEATSKTVERPGAPAPITPIASSGTAPVQVDPAKMNFRELREYERARRQNRR